MPKEKKSDDNKIIKKKTKVTVSNTLNQMVFEQKDMNLQAFRMLMFYLAKINPKRPDFTEVRISLESYAEMLGVELNEQAIDASTNLLLGYVVKTGMVDAGEYIIRNAKYSVFSICRLLERKSDGKRMLEFKCSEDIKPLIFELQEKFTTFNVWNVLNLSNFQDIRMYMLLSQFKVAGTRTFTLEELKEKLGIAKNAYPEYKIFSRDVLKKCQKALKERTDLCFEFRSVGRPAHSVCFEIHSNKDYKILSYLSEASESPSALPEDPEQLSFDATVDELNKRDERARICFGFDSEEFAEFTLAELEQFKSLAWGKVPSAFLERHQINLDYVTAKQYAVADYVRSKILYCNAYPEPVVNRVRFINRAIEEDWK